MKKQIQVHILATEDATNLFRWGKNGAIGYINPITEPSINATNQHLYITDDSEIKENDWYFIISDNEIRKANGHEIETNEPDNPEYRKIIASTDSKITADYSTSGTTFVAQPSQEFIKLFCELIGKGEFEADYSRTMDGTATYNRLIVNPDNTINITLVDEKVYTRVEVESILFQYAEDEHGWFSCKSEIESFNDWVDENL